VFLSLADRDKPAGLEVARSFAAWGLDLAATSGTAAFLESKGVPVDTVVAKVGEVGGGRRRRPHRQGKVQLVVNTPRGRGRGPTVCTSGRPRWPTWCPVSPPWPRRGRPRPAWPTGAVTAVGA
jgi:hypothetical protein